LRWTDVSKELSVELFKKKDPKTVPASAVESVEGPLVGAGVTIVADLDVKEEILAISLRDAQNIQGMVVGFINANSMKVTITREGDCLRVVGSKTNKVIPLSNIRSYDCLQPGQPRPVVASK